MTNVKLLSTPVPRHSFRWTPKCMSHSIRERECNIIAACECDYLGLNVIAWNHCRSDPVQVQSTVPPYSIQCEANFMSCTHMVLPRPPRHVLVDIEQVTWPPQTKITTPFSVNSIWYIVGCTLCTRKNSGSHIDASLSRQPLLKL